MKEFEPTKPNGFIQENAHTTTLVVENIPSQVAYEIVELALSADEHLTREELARRVNERLNAEYTILSNEELETLLKHVAKCSIFDIKEPVSFYMEPQEEFSPMEPQKEFSPENSIPIGKEEKDEFGRTPYIIEIIEEAKEEMHQNKKWQQHIDRDIDKLPLRR